MKRIIHWLCSVRAFRIVSLALCLYMAITAFGVSGSYKDAFDVAVLFYIVWILGHESREVIHNGCLSQRDELIAALEKIAAMEGSERDEWDAVERVMPKITEIAIQAIDKSMRWSKV